MPYMNIFILMMIYELFPYFLKKFQKYKLTLNVIVHVILKYKTCHQFQ